MTESENAAGSREVQEAKITGRSENWFFKQSSELELLISAAIVFASFKVSALVEAMIFTLLNNNVPSNSEWLFLLAVVSLFTSSILPVSIVAHFLLRFYWLSLVGLRSVFNGTPEIKGFAARFRKTLKKPLDLDSQIETIDRISSSIFAFSFMTLFAFIFSISSVVIFIFFILPSIAQLFDSDLLNTILGWIGNIFLLVCLIYMVDFFTLGWMKRIKKKWFVRLYYPIYRFMSAITFSFFYRGIYYSLVENTSKRFMAVLLPAYVFITIFLLNAGYSSSKIFDTNLYFARGKDIVLKSWYYADQFPENVHIQSPFIDSFEVPAGINHLNLQVPITAALEDSLLARCDDIVPINKRRSFNWRKYLQTDLNRPRFEQGFVLSENGAKIIECLKLNSTVHLDDTIEIDPKYRFSEWQDPKRPIFTSVVDLYELGRGEHNLTLRYNRGTDTTEYRIPFWRD